MSEYATYEMIKIKSKILEKPVLEAYRAGNLDLQNVQGRLNPLVQVYKQTYQYLMYPEIQQIPSQLVKPQKI